MKKYRKKPIVVEAVEWTGKNQDEIMKFIGDSMYWKGDGLHIFTLEGDHFANIGDFIIKGVANEFYPCKPNIFWKTYEEV